MRLDLNILAIQLEKQWELWIITNILFVKGAKSLKKHKKTDLNIL